MHDKKSKIAFFETHDKEDVIKRFFYGSSYNKDFKKGIYPYRYSTDSSGSYGTEIIAVDTDRIVEIDQFNNTITLKSNDGRSKLVLMPHTLVPDTVYTAYLAACQKPDMVTSVYFDEHMDAEIQYI